MKQSTTFKTLVHTPLMDKIHKAVRKKKIPVLGLELYLMKQIIGR